MSKRALASMLAFAAMYGDMLNITGENNIHKTKVNTLDTTLRIKPIPAGCQRFKFESDRGEFQTDALTEKRAIEKFNKWYEKEPEKNSICAACIWFSSANMCKTCNGGSNYTKSE
jgi:hypothetical protein